MSGSISAHAESFWVFLDLDNDVVSGEDRHYSNGFLAGAAMPQATVPNWLVWVSRLLPTKAPPRKGLRWSLSLGQQMYTPEDYSRSDLIRGERPYAGWLFVRTGIDRRHSSAESGYAARADFLEWDIGVVGPAALAEETQSAIHKIFGTPRFEGWAHQLKNEFGVVIRGGRNWRIPGRVVRLGAGVEVDLLAGVQGELGNVTTALGTRLWLRAGYRLPRDFGRGRSNLESNEGRTLRVYAFLGLDQKLVAQNIFLDGNSLRSSHSVSRKPYVIEVPAGAAVEFGRFRGRFTWIYRSREFSGQDGHDAYGRASLAWAF